MKVGDSYKLPCGHFGTVRAIYGDTVAVEGPTRGSFCVHCNPRRSRREPTILLVALHVSKDPTLSNEKKVMDTKATASVA